MSKIKVKDYFNYTRIDTPVRNGKRVHYRHKLTGKIFSDGFYLNGNGRFNRSTREGERIFDITQVFVKKNS